MVTGQAPDGEDGDDLVKRRELLAGVASVAAARMIAVPAATGEDVTTLTLNVPEQVLTDGRLPTAW